MHLDTLERCDVVIAGGGLVGLTLAYQLARADASLTILVLEAQPGPLPQAAYKVGESLTELSTRYLSETIELRDHLEQQHLRKLGLRYFFGDPHQPFEQRPEVGPKNFPALDTRQIDRGVIEEHLRERMPQVGVILWDNAKLVDVDLDADNRVGGENGEHVVRWSRAGATGSTKCRWMVDAMGRRRFLQRKLDLKRPNGHDAYATWWRLKGRFDVDAIPADPDDAWLRRNDQPRWFSTNHIMGKGYWIWIIPLKTGHTSIGIMSCNRVFSSSDRRNWSEARSWLQRHEPHLAKLLDGAEPLDYQRRNHFSYSAKQVFSANRWCTVGDAAVFQDPFYAPGIDLATLSNSLVTQLVLADRRQELRPEVVDTYNDTFLELHDTYIELYENNYPIFHSFEVMSFKIIWDAALHWTFAGQIVFNGGDLEGAFVAGVHRSLQRVRPINRAAQRLFRQYEALIDSKKTADFVNYDLTQLTPQPGETPRKGQFYSSWYKDTYRNLACSKTHAQTLEYIEAKTDEFEIWLNALYRFFVAQTHPEGRRLVARHRGLIDLSEMNLEAPEASFAQPKEPAPIDLRWLLPF